ncbi:MAG: hypothetical protein ACI8VC_002906 [Candidatus Endobugula sp.]|jgi:hypothetical protein
MNFKGIKKKLLRFKRLFTTHWLTFVGNNPRYDTHYCHSEVKKMLSCGSKENGFATYQCLGCGKGEHKVNFSCKGKACPQCGKRYARDSMIKIATKLFPGVSYRQVVLTLPEQLRTPFHNHPNQSHLYLRFMGLAEPCLTELIQAHFKNSSYKIALTVFLHTNGRNGSYNPHLHVILAEGALLPGAKHWRTFKHLSLSRLRLLWQQYLLAAMESEFPERNVVIQALRDDYPDGFYAHPGNHHKEKVPTKSYQALVRYLTKYLSSPPIGVARIVAYDDQEVKYYYQSYRAKSRVYETLCGAAFVGEVWS